MTDAIQKAASWLATEKNLPRPVIPTLRRQFGLTTSEAIDAIRESHLIKARAH